MKQALEFNEVSVMDASEKIARARKQMLERYPMWGTLVRKLKVRESRNPKMKTAVTDGRVLEWARPFIDALSVAQVSAVLAHETGHCALKHVFRRGGRDHEAYEEACDHVVNLLLKKDGFDLPSFSGMEPFADAQFDGMAVEQVYPIVLARRAKEQEEAEQQQQQQAQQQDQQQGAKGKKQKSEQQPQQDEQQPAAPEEAEEAEEQSMGGMRDPGSLGDGDDESPESEEKSEKGEKSDAQEEGDEPSDEDGEEGSNQSPDDRAEEESEDEAQRSQQGDASQDASDSDERDGKQEQQNAQSSEMGEADAKALEADWAQSAAAAAQQAVKQGHGSRSMQRTILQSIAQPVSFEEYLRYFLARCSDRSEQTWRRQARRSIASENYLPGRRGQSMGALAIVIDTSGSVNDAVLARFFVQVGAAQADLNPREVIVIAADDEVQKETRFTRGENVVDADRASLVVGGGGTDFRPALKRVMEIQESEGIEIAGVLYLTDLEGDFPTAEEAQDYPPTLWCFDSSTCWSVEHKQRLLGAVTYGEVAEMVAR